MLLGEENDSWYGVNSFDDPPFFVEFLVVRVPPGKENVSLMCMSSWVRSLEVVIHDISKTEKVNDSLTCRPRRQLV